VLVGHDILLSSLELLTERLTPHALLPTWLRLALYELNGLFQEQFYNGYNGQGQSLLTAFTLILFSASLRLDWAFLALTPSMRRPVDVKHTLTFFFLSVCSHSAKPPLSPSFHPHSL
jgi:hypothetical protein